MQEVIFVLRRSGIQPTPQRIAVLNWILKTNAHPSAEELLKKVRQDCPTLSRATVYNTLNLFVEKGLIKPQILKEGSLVFDLNIDKHHHFIDEESGKIYDLPWDTFAIKIKNPLTDFEISDLQVVVRGRKKKK